MSVLILASVSTFLVILFATTAYVVNNGTFSKMRTDYDSKMQGIVSQMNNTEFKNYEKDRQNNAVLNRNLKNINTLQEDELKMQTDIDNFKKMYSDNTTEFRTDLTATTSNLNYLTQVVNNMPTAEQTHDILGLQGTTQNHETRIQGNESALTANGASITSLNTKTLAHSNAIISLSNQIRTNTAELNNLTSQNQININKIYLQGLSNQTISQNLSNLEGNFTTYSRGSTNWMAYAHSNLYSNVMPTLNTINQNYVAKANYNAHSNSVTADLSNINHSLSLLPGQYANLQQFNLVKTKTDGIQGQVNILDSVYTGLSNTYATKADLLTVRITASNSSNLDAMLSNQVNGLSGTIAGIIGVNATQANTILQNTTDISTLKSQYTGLDNNYKSIITTSGSGGSRTFKFDANDNTFNKPAFQIVNGTAVHLDINTNGTTTLNNLNINATGTTNFSGNTKINNQVPATQPWVQSVIAPKTNNTRFINNWSGDADGTSSQIADDTGSYKALMLAGNRSLNNGVRNVQVYDDLMVSRNAQVNGSLNANGDIKAANLKIGSTFTADGATLSNTGRQHVYSGELLYLLPKNGVEVGKEWGGNGNLNAQGNISANGGIKGKDWVRSDTGFHVDNGKAWLSNDGTVFGTDWMRSDTGFHVQNGRAWLNNDGTVFANNWMRSDTGFYIQNDSAWMRNDGVIKGNKIYTTDITRGKNDGDWLRINTDNMNTGVGTAIHNHVAINGGGGLDVGQWVKRPEGEIHANKIVSRGEVVLNNNTIKLRDAGDNNHTLSYEGDVDGPVLKGWAGGALGTTGGTSKVLQWNKDGTVQINGGLKICDTNGKNCKNVLVEGNSIKLQSQANNRFIGNTNNWEGNGSDPNNPSGGYSCINANGWKCGITTLQVANAPNVNQNWTIYKN